MLSRDLTKRIVTKAMPLAACNCCIVKAILDVASALQASFAAVGQVLNMSLFIDTC